MNLYEFMTRSELSSSLSPGRDAVVRPGVVRTALSVVEFGDCHSVSTVPVTGKVVLLHEWGSFEHGVNGRLESTGAVAVDDSDDMQPGGVSLRDVTLGDISRLRLRHAV